MYDTIVVPTDGSVHAVRAAEHARYLAAAFGATVHVISVADVQAAADLSNADADAPEVIARAENEKRSAIEAVEATFEENETVRTAILRGTPTDAIIEYADEHDADVIAMGTHGWTGIQRYVLGSVTERVVRLADRPVLTAHATERGRGGGQYNDIMIPTDGSEPAAAAIDHGLAIAQAADARIHAVNIVDIGPLTMLRRNFSAPKLLERLESIGENATATIATRAEDTGLAATTTVSEGIPASGLLDYVDEHGIDLVTMGTTGQTGLDRYLLGSTAERVIRRAETPVLAVNARDQTVD